MNNSNATQQGLPPPHPLHHPRSAGLIQQHRPNSPHQSHTLQSSSQGPYISPHSSSHSLPQHHSPYVGSVPGIHHPHHPGEATFFTAHPSPYSTNSATGSYASSDANEAMATQAAMSRQPYPPIQSYQTPQSNSPASIHSPHTDAHGRPYTSFPPMAQSMYYPQTYPMQQPSPYAQHPSAAPQHPSLASTPGMLMSHQQSQQSLQHQQQQQQQHQQQQHQHQHAHAHHQQQQHHQQHQHQPQTSHPQSSIIDAKPIPPPLQSPSSIIGPPKHAPQTPSGPGMQSGSGMQSGPGMQHSLSASSSVGPNNQSAAPGPIPATTPLVVRQDNNGVQWIAFEYSRDRVKMEYTIRCDVESVNVEELGQEFKSANCVYPRACCGKDQYKGNRLAYESECNAVGWALAQLNPNLREKRGLIQRAVDSWRNSNQDPRLRSRRVRRMAKVHTRKQQLGPGSTSQLPVPPGPGSAGLQTPHGLSMRPPMGPAGSQMHHHHGDGSAGSDDVSGGNEYSSSNATPQHTHPSGQADMPSPTAARYAQGFYPQYPQQPGAGGSSMPSVHDAMDTMPSHASTLATPIAASVKDEDEESKRNLFGDLPEAKRRKFILVEDKQNRTRVRVRVTLDQVKMDDMPDAHLRNNAVYPRSFFPRQMRSPPGSPRSGGQWNDEDDSQEGASGAAPTRGKTHVPVSLMDGSEAQLPVPRMTKSRRAKEVALNELGYRMSWGQARAFNGRTLFLQRSLDAYRNKMRSSMVSHGNEPSKIASHFETRLGKQRWLEWNKRAREATD